MNHQSEKSVPSTGLSCHTSESIFIQEHQRRLTMHEGTNPSEFRLFRVTHTKKDGSWVDARSQQVEARIDELLSQASQADSTDWETSIELS